MAGHIYNHATFNIIWFRGFWLDRFSKFRTYSTRPWGLRIIHCKCSKRINAISAIKRLLTKFYMTENFDVFSFIFLFPIVTSEILKATKFSWVLKYEECLFSHLDLVHSVIDKLIFSHPLLLMYWNNFYSNIRAGWKVPFGYIFFIFNSRQINRPLKENLESQLQLSYLIFPCSHTEPPTSVQLKHTISKDFWWLSPAHSANICYHFCIIIMISFQILLEQEEIRHWEMGQDPQCMQGAGRSEVSTTWRHLEFGN